MKKSERLQMIIMYLKQNGKLSAQDLAEYLEVSKRTVYRDIDAISQMNVPIIAYEGTTGGYEIDDSYFMPTVKLSEREVLILMLLLKFSKQLNLPDFNESINVLDLKLKNACQDHGEQYKNILQYVTIDVQNIFPESHVQGAFETILDAFNRNVKLKIKYYSPLKNKTVERDITPFHFFYSEGGWYLEAFCHLRSKKRTFRLDRIIDIALLSERADDMLKKQYNDEILEDPKLLIEFDISRDLFNLIRYDNAMRDAKIISETESDLRILIETNRLVYFETLAFRNSDHVTILKPSSLTEKLKQKFLNALQKY